MRPTPSPAVLFLLRRRHLALGVGLTRWPEVHLLPADLFYLVLTAHGINVLMFWIIFFEMAVLHFASRRCWALPYRHAEARLGRLPG
jgi:heme/copper-type cytochrome/quinol oxidase subunit 1